MGVAPNRAAVGIPLNTAEGKRKRLEAWAAANPEQNNDDCKTRCSFLGSGQGGGHHQPTT